MGATASAIAVPLQQELFAAPRRFAFAQVIDLLEQIDASARRMGAGTDPAREAARLTAAFTLAFRAGPIAQLDTAGAHGQPALSVNFMGLGGADGPLPEPFVDLVMEQQRSGGTAARFLAIFQHRLLSFAYRCENEFRVAAPFRPASDSPLHPALSALLGLPAAPQQRRLAAILLANASTAVEQRRSMAGLLALLRAHFGAAVVGEQFAGCWTALPDQLQTVLGSAGRNDRLGQGVVLGQRAWDQGGAVRIRFAPLGLAAYLALLPHGSRHGDLARICAFYLGAHVRCFVHLELAPPPDGDASAACYVLGHTYLGHTSWLAGAAGSDCAQRRVTLTLNAPTENRHEH